MAQPRTERKRLANLPVHLARRQISSHLSDDLIKKFGKRSVVLRVGDTVKVMRGEFAGTTGKVLSVDTRARKVEVEGVTVEKSDKTKVPRPVDASNLLVTKLDLSDKLRREKIGASDADATPAEPRPKKTKAREADEEEGASGKEGADDEEEKKTPRGSRAAQKKANAEEAEQ